MHVYFHRNPITYDIFYVGIGNSKRPYSIEGRNSFWRKTVAKYGKPVVQIVHENIAKDRAIEWEIFYIKTLGRRHEGGLLVNLTCGGETGSDIPEIRERISLAVANFYIKSPLARKAASMKMKKHYQAHPWEYTPARKAAMEKNKADNHSSKRPEVRRKISESNKGKIGWNKGITGKKHSEDARNKIGISHKGKKLNTEHVEKIRLAHTGKKTGESTKEKLKIIYADKFISISMIHNSSGEVMQSFDTIHDAARFINQPNGAGNISQCVRGKRNTAYGYKWCLN